MVQKNVLLLLQNLQDQLVDYQPKLTLLKQTCEQLRTLGQSASSEELLRLTAEYEELSQQVALQKTKLTQAVELREVYHGNRGEVETKLKQLEEQMDAVDVQGVPVPTKLDRYKVWLLSKPLLSIKELRLKWLGLVSF